MTDGDDVLENPPNNPRFDRERARRSARDPDRPGLKCRALPKVHAPVIDRNRCEGKADCAAVCPFGVFEVRRIDEADYRALSFLGRLKSRAHGKLTSYASGAEACQACGLCVVACPENAIALVELASSAT